MPSPCAIIPSPSVPFVDRRRWVEYTIYNTILAERPQFFVIELSQILDGFLFDSQFFVVYTRVNRIELRGLPYQPLG